jgi:hypothetical protein
VSGGTVAPVSKEHAMNEQRVDINELKQQVASLAQQLQRLQAQLAKLTGAPPHEEPVRPEILVIIAAAVSTFLGKRIRIRSARMLQTPYEIVNHWSQQGRVSVQASHTLRRER